VEGKEIEYVMDDGRYVHVSFHIDGGNVGVIETFDAENENSAEMQRQGWQMILDRFARYVEDQAGI
jgi:hypothetical protein